MDTLRSAFGRTISILLLTLYARLMRAKGEEVAKCLVSEAKYQEMDSDTFIATASFMLDFFGDDFTSISSDHVWRASAVSASSSVGKFFILAGSDLRNVRHTNGRKVSTHEANKLARRYLKVLTPVRNEVSWGTLRYVAEFQYETSLKLLRMWKNDPLTMIRLMRSGNCGYGTGPEGRTLRSMVKLARLRMEEQERESFVGYILQNAYLLHEGLGFAGFRERYENSRKSLSSRLTELRKDKAYRVRDKRYESNPSMAVIDHTDYSPSVCSQFTLGREIGELSWHICEKLAKEARETSRPIVIYGRDCETYYRLMREFYTDVETSYALAPRTLTTGGGGRNREDHRRYLRRLIPDNAIHFDSGFAGTIPDWVASEMGISVYSIRLISTTNPDRALLGRASMNGRMRSIVIEKIEHVPHRLVESTEDCWRAWRFDSEGVREFWARMEGLRSIFRAIRAGLLKPRSLTEIVGDEDCAPEDCNVEVDNELSCGCCGGGSCEHTCE